MVHLVLSVGLDKTYTLNNLNVAHEANLMSYYLQNEFLRFQWQITDLELHVGTLRSFCSVHLSSTIVAFNYETASHSKR